MIFGKEIKGGSYRYEGEVLGREKSTFFFDFGSWGEAEKKRKTREKGGIPS